MKIGGTARGLSAALAKLSVEQVAQTALAAAGGRLAEAIRAALSVKAPAPTGTKLSSIGHDEPWLRTGALRDGVSVQADGDAVRVVSVDQAARAQEFGTARTPPRPVLGPAAATHGRAIADAVGQAVAELFR